MKRQTLTINSVEFELFKADAGASARFTNGAAYDEIYEAYGRPSGTKVLVWHVWCEWCYSCIEKGIPCTLGIASHNCMQFSIDGKIQYGGHVYALWITRCHNRAYIIA